MTTETNESRSARFRRCHDALFFMPNAWDVASARLLATHAPALGTSSAAAAAARGLPDGERIGRAESLAAAAVVIDAAGATPVNVDLEAGFGDTPDQVAASVAEAIGLGAAGVNLEDTDPATGELREAARQAEIVAAVAETIAARDPDVVLNARTDVFWNPVGEPAERPAHACARLEAYRRAGASCLFAPGLQGTAAALGAEDAVVADVVGACAPVPVNLLASSGLGLSPARLAELGVRRISFGSSLYRAALAQAGALVGAATGSGDFAALAAADALPYGRLIELVT